MGKMHLRRWSIATMVLTFSFGLSGCSLAASSSGVFYKVEYYTDYVGVDYEAPMRTFDPSNPSVLGGILIGHDYVSVKPTDKARPTHFSDDGIYDPSTKSSGSSKYDNKSNQTPLSDGYHYSFKGWKGYYVGRTSSSSSSQIDQSIYPVSGDPISTAFIRDDCKLFAYYVSEPNSYSIKLQNFDKSVLYSIAGQYLVAPDSSTLHTIESIVDPLHDSGGVDPYYKTWLFKGWKDQSGVITSLLTTDEIKGDLRNGMFTKDMTFVAQYEDPTVNTYTVSFYQSDASENPTSIKLGTQTVTYGTGISWSTADKTVAEHPSEFDGLENPYLASSNAHHTNVFTGWKGNYKTGSDVPSSIQGTAVQSTYIRFNCDLYAVYDMNVIDRYTVKFYQSGADLTTNPTPLCTKTIDYGDPVSYTGPEQALAGSTFVGWIDEAGNKPNLNSITANLNLFASFVPNLFTVSDATYGSFTYAFVAAKNGYELSSYTVGTSTELTSSVWSIAPFPNGYPLIGIGKNAFKDSSVSKVSFAEGLDYIGEAAFSGCVSLTEVSFAEGLTSIGTSAFSGDNMLAKAPLPSSTKTIGASAFLNCLNLGEVTFGSSPSLTSIGNGAFRGCSKLASIFIPLSVSFIDAYAFAYSGSPLRIYCQASSRPSGWNIYWNDDGGIVYWYSENNPTTSGDYWHESGGTISPWPSSIGFTFSLNLDGNSYSVISYDETAAEIAVPSSYNGKAVTGIADEAFKGCTSLISVSIPVGVVAIGEEAFAGCSKLAYVNLPAGLINIMPKAFYGDRVLKNISLPASLTTLSEYAFGDCASLKGITFSPLSNLTTIGSHCFDGDSGLVSLVLPQSVMTIGKYAVYGCTSLTSLSLLVSAAEAASRSYDPRWNYISETTYVDITYAI